MTVLCTDKTGTLTQNKISVVGIWNAEPFTDKDVIFYAALASKKENEDPIDLAVLSKLDANGDSSRPFVSSSIDIDSCSTVPSSLHLIPSSSHWCCSC